MMSRPAAVELTPEVSSGRTALRGRRPHDHQRSPRTPELDRRRELDSAETKAATSVTAARRCGAAQAAPAYNPLTLINACINIPY